VNIRRATAADEAAIRELWEEFEREVPEPPGWVPETWDEEWGDVQLALDDGAVYLAEDDEGVAGVARATPPDHGRSHLALVHVRPRARRQGVAKALVLACAGEVHAKGAERMSLEVIWSNALARQVWKRFGFAEQVLVMDTDLAALEQRLGEHQTGENRAATHVQTDDHTSVARALSEFVPRLEAPDVRDSPNGWIRVQDPVTDGDRQAQMRLAKDLSERLGAVVVAVALEEGSVVRYLLYENGRMVDEYLSVPSFYGALSKGDELALAANPTLVARLTGAQRDDVHRIAQTADSPDKLPPAADLYRLISIMMGLEP
jgi:ribosomal protein S18 acetylase RimI-like enzyme